MVWLTWLLLAHVHRQAMQLPQRDQNIRGTEPVRKLRQCDPNFKRDRLARSSKGSDSFVPQY
eukprot:2596220-Amphidinium_carterae.1